MLPPWQHLRTANAISNWLRLSSDDLYIYGVISFNFSFEEIMCLILLVIFLLLQLLPPEFWHVPFLWVIKCLKFPLYNSLQLKRGIVEAFTKLARFRTGVSGRSGMERSVWRHFLAMTIFISGCSQFEDMRTQITGKRTKVIESFHFISKSFTHSKQSFSCFVLASCLMSWNIILPPSQFM